MRYLVQTTRRNKTLTYQRHWPTALAEKAKQMGYGAKFTMPTGVSINADTVKQAQAQAIGNAEFNRTVDLISSVGSHTTGFMLNVPTGKRGTFTRTRAVDKKQANRLQQQITLFRLLDLWAAANPDVTPKALKYRQTYWDQWCRCVGSDEVAKADSIEAIHVGLDRWQAEMQARGCTAATVRRARGSVVAVLRWASTEWRLGWHIELKKLAAARAKPKAVLSVPEQRRLLALVVEEKSVTSAMAALMLAGGLMPSEISRLDPAVVVESLSASTPYVVIGRNSDVKAEARRRVVPVVWPADVVDVLIDKMPEAIERAAAAADPSATVNKWFKTRGFGISGHGLRHTLAAAASAAVGNPLALARIGGWSGSGLNPIMLGYGAGVEDSQLLNELAVEARRWFAAVIVD